MLPPDDSLTAHGDFPHHAAPAIDHAVARDRWLVALWIAGAIVVAAAVLLLIAAIKPAAAHDDGKFANSPLKAWFDRLASGKGLCCSFADGVSVQDVDWDTKGGHYRVRLNKQWVVVPGAAVVTEPNKFGPAVVWPYQDMNGATQIRCFLPGAGA
jgi:hypothetical protein